MAKKIICNKCNKEIGAYSVVCYMRNPGIDIYGGLQALCPHCKKEIEIKINLRDIDKEVVTE